MTPTKFWTALLTLLAGLLLSFSSPTSVRALTARPAVPSPAAPQLQGSPVVLPAALRFDRISLEEGLSQSAILAMRQDQQGFMWFGTEGGLNRYDGYDFTVYKNDSANPQSLGDNYVSFILDNPDGTLWVGTRSGLDKFDPFKGVFSHLRNDPANPNSLGGKWVVALCRDRDGSLWIGTDDGGLDRFDPVQQTFAHYRHDANDPQTISANSVRALYQDQDGKLWVATSAGLDRLDRAAGTFTHYRHDLAVDASLSDNQVTTLYQDQQGVLWVGTEQGGLNQWDPVSQGFIHYRSTSDDPHSLSHNRVKAILQDRSGRLWIGTQNGLDQFDAQRKSFIHIRHDPGDPHSLSADTIWSIYEDRSGVLWFGTYSDGVNKYSDLNNRFAVYRHAPLVNSLSDNMIWSLCQDRSGMLWIGTFNGGLNRLNLESGIFFYYRHKPADPASLSSDDVRAILQDHEGNLWVGTSGGLDRLESGMETFAHYRNDPGDSKSLSDNRVNVLLEDREGNLWVGTRSGGLNRLDRATGAFTRYRHDPTDASSLSDDRVWALYQDRAGAIWVGTLGGINVLEPGGHGFKHYTHDPANPSSLSNNSAFSFYQDTNNAVWIGTWGDGLDRFDPTTQTFAHLTEKQGLPDNVIYGIEPDAQGYLWLSTNHGLARFDPRTGKVRNYDIRDGLQSNEFNAGAHAGGKDGLLFFGGTQGLNIFDPGQIRDNPQVPVVVITGFSKFNRTARANLPDAERIQLGYNDNFVSFDFSTLDFTSPAKNQYAYKMEGLDNDWVNAGTRRHADYPNLSPGEYVFRVKGSNNDGVWNERGVAVYINITPPFWETWWFRGVVVLVLAALGVAAFRWRVSSIQARSRDLEKQVVARTAEIERHTRELEALYRADQELHSHLGLDQVLRALVDVAVDQLHADKSIIFVRDEARNGYVCRIARGLDPMALDHITISAGDGTIGRVAETGEPVVVEDNRDESQRKLEKVEILEMADREGIRSYMSVPLQLQHKVLGIFTVGFAEPHNWSSEEQRLYLSLAQRAALAVENAQLYERAQQAAALEERTRLARELHDAVTQTLFSASLVADVLPKIWEKNQDRGRTLLNDLRLQNRGALAEMRTLLLELRPASLTDAKLGDLLRQLSEAFTGRTSIPIQLEVADPCAPPVNVKIAFYRIAQEGLNNIAKHAHATQVELCMRSISAPTSRAGELAVLYELVLHDNGCGFDPSQIPAGHLGVGIIRERAAAIGAEVEIDSQVGRGTEIRVRWPSSTV